MHLLLLNRNVASTLTFALPINPLGTMSVHYDIYSDIYVYYSQKYDIFIHYFLELLKINTKNIKKSELLKGYDNICNTIHCTEKKMYTKIDQALFSKV